MDKTIPCRVCGRPTTYLGTKLCDSCWRVEGGIERFLEHEEGRKIVSDCLAMQRERELNERAAEMVECVGSGFVHAGECEEMLDYMASFSESVGFSLDELVRVGLSYLRED